MLMELQSPFYFAMGAMNILSWKMGSHIRLRVAAVDIICLLGVSVVHYRHARHYAFPPLTTPVCVALLGLVGISAGLILHKMCVDRRAEHARDEEDLKPGFLTEEKKPADKES